MDVVEIGSAKLASGWVALLFPLSFFVTPSARVEVQAVFAQQQPATACQAVFAQQQPVVCAWLYLSRGRDTHDSAATYVGCPKMPLPSSVASRRHVAAFHSQFDGRKKKRKV